jgi:hypothetical protein
MPGVFSERRWIKAKVPGVLRGDGFKEEEEEEVTRRNKNLPFSGKQAISYFVL